jgi:TPR repeat protein
MYANGDGVTKDDAQARRWYQKASNAGFALGDHDLGIVYLFGQGVRADPKKAIDLFAKAANTGLATSILLLGMIYQQGFGSIKSDQKTALEWFQKGATLGQVDCQDSLGWIYANGIGVERDYSLAVKWYRSAAEQNDPVGAYGLGVRYMTGQGVVRDVVEAMKWFRTATDAGHADAAFNLALILSNQIPGRDGPPDFVSAAKFLTIAANQGISDGQCVLGLLYANGYGVPQDDVTAYQWVFLSLRGTNQCDQDRVALQARMTSAQLAEAKRRAAEFTPVPSKFNYGPSVPR